MVKNSLRAALVAGLLAASGLCRAGDLGSFLCGELGNGYGPFDYRTATPEQHVLVEGAHFTGPVEALQQGKTATTPGPDIDYTLRVFPNHHRALLATMNLGLKEKRSKPIGMRYPVECWLERAERFRPDDSVVQMLYGIFLMRANRQPEAMQKFAAAEKSDERNPNLYYNLGLAYFDMKRYDEALANAHKAYALNYPLPGLREKLKRAGKWREAPPPAPEASTPVASVSAPGAKASAPEPRTSASAP